MPSFNGNWTASQQLQARGANTWPTFPGAPTIGTATAGINNCGSVTFTAPSSAGYPTALTYRVTSTPGCFSNTWPTSPVVVSGLTNGTSYTFKVRATNATGTGPCSAASNSITASVPSCATYTTNGTYSWVAPAGVTNITYLIIGGGGNGGNPAVGNSAGCCLTIFIGGGGGGGGGLAYRSSFSVTPGTSYNVTISNSGNNFFNTFGDAYATSGGAGGSSYTSPGAAGSYGGSATAGYNGGAGGAQGQTYCFSTPSGGGGGGAAGYSGTGGAGGSENANGSTGSGGGGGGGAGGQRDQTSRGGGSGGGTGIYGPGSSGAGGVARSGGGGAGSGGGAGINPGAPTGGAGGAYGGGGGGGGWNGSGGAGGSAVVRIVWYSAARGTPSFPSTNVGA